MNFAQLIDPERVLAMRSRVEVKPARERALDGQPHAKHFRPGEQRAALLAALKDGPLAVAEIHAAIGGSKNSLGVLVATMKKAGELLVSGDSGKYRYGLPA